MNHVYFSAALCWLAPELDRPKIKLWILQQIENKPKHTLNMWHLHLSCLQVAMVSLFTYFSLLSFWLIFPSWRGLCNDPTRHLINLQLAVSLAYSEILRIIETRQTFNRAWITFDLKQNLLKVKDTSGGWQLVCNLKIRP